MKKNEIVLFETFDHEISIQVHIEQDTVWLNRNQIAELFERDVKTIGRHINNALKEELDISTVAKFATVQLEGDRQVERDIEYYNLDMIISVGYRVKSARGIEFRRWANSVLKQYILQGYAINEKRLIALEKTVEIQSRMLADTLDLDQSGVLKAVREYTRALTLLDQYDHQSLEKPEGKEPLYRITYEECRTMVNQMEDSFKSAVYQNVFGEELYPSIEEKAANLLYFMIKDHPFADGCKRIAASLFLEFLSKNNSLYKNGTKIISDGALVAITLMIAESNPQEKDIMTAMVMNLLEL